MSLVIVDKSDGVATLTLNNPTERNTLTAPMVADILAAMDDVENDSAIGAIVVTGAAPAFCAGANLGNLATATPESLSNIYEGFLRIARSPLPTIAAVNGAAVGAGMNLALGCDIRIAAEDAKFMLPEAGHGVIPDTGGVGRLFQMCGHGVVSDMVLTGRSLDAQAALALGIVSRVVTREELDDTAMEMALKIAASPAVTIKLARRVIQHLAQPEITTSMADELIYQTFLNKSEDYAEFRAARAEDRTPNYRGS